MLRSAATALALALASLLANPVQAAPPKKAAAAAPAGRNWNQMVVRTPRESFVLGNPDASVKLVEYISYTCPHCAHFTQEADGQLRLGFIAPGKGSIEVRNFVRDPIDLTVALLTHCVAPAQFWQTHLMFLIRQSDWIGTEMSASEAQRQRWSTGPLASRTRAIASDFKFYDMMASRGVSRVSVDRCLADEALANKLAAGTKEAAEKDYVEGTPAFLINGLPLAGTASWAALKPQLEARMN
jgi:protein-disulfide isomerase